jgi:hypothetical protein
MDIDIDARLAVVLPTRGAAASSSTVCPSGMVENERKDAAGLAVGDPDAANVEKAGSAVAVAAALAAVEVVAAANMAAAAVEPIG